MKRKNTLVEIWGDVIKIKDLILSTSITSSLAIGGHALASNGNTSRLFYALTGAVVGFIISSSLIKPKRNLINK